MWEKAKTGAKNEVLILVLCDFLTKLKSHSEAEKCPRKLVLFEDIYLHAAFGVTFAGAGS